MTTTPEPHACGNCEGIDPDTCLTNPDRPHVSFMDAVEITTEEEVDGPDPWEPVPCSAAVLRHPHASHGWTPQPGMTPVRCLGFEATATASPTPKAPQSEAPTPGGEATPNPCRCPCYGCKHNCAAHNPATAGEATQLGTAAATSNATAASVGVDPALRDRIARAARTVPIRLGPNALAMAQRGEAIILNYGEADDLAAAVLAELAPELTRADLGDRTHRELASLAMNAANALADEKRHYAIACAENARLRDRAERAETALAAGIPLVCSDERHQAKVTALEARIAQALAVAEVIDANGIHWAADAIRRALTGPDAAPKEPTP